MMLERGKSSHRLMLDNSRRVCSREYFFDFPLSCRIASYSNALFAYLCNARHPRLHSISPSARFPFMPLFLRGKPRMYPRIIFSNGSLAVYDVADDNAYINNNAVPVSIYYVELIRPVILFARLLYFCLCNFLACYTRRR